jgi:NhaA family Na+:H+ antiporter
MGEQVKEFARKVPAKNHRLLSNDQYEEIDQMQDHLRKVSSPLQRLENGLHDITLKWIMPIFAFANAGMVLGGLDWGQWATGGLTNGIFWGLLAGKLVGIVGFTWLGKKLGWIEIPASITFRHLVGAGFLAGIGFTMSIFITELAFHGDTLITFSKVSILAASIVSGIAGFLILKGASSPS